MNASWVELASMGAYGEYVWSAYAIAGGILVCVWVSARWQRIRVRRQLTQWLKRASQ